MSTLFSFSQRPTRVSWIAPALVAGVLLAACRGAPSAAGTQPVVRTPVIPTSAAESVNPPAPPAREGVVTVIGQVEPVKWVELSFQQSGPVAEVLVIEGASVTAGQPLARLATADLELSMQAAEAALATAQARLVEASVGARPEEVAAAEGALAAANAAISAAVAARDRVGALPGSAAISAAQAAVSAAEAQEKASQIAYDNIIFNENLGPPEEKARYELIAAEQALLAAQANLAEVQAGSSAQELQEAAASVSEAVALRNSTQANLDLVRAGPRPESLAVMQAEIAEAQISIAEAQLALSQVVLAAPFDGTVVSLGVNTSQQVVGGAPVMILADLTNLQIAATDLDELNVSAVQVGQPATITLDALPGREFAGKVAFVAFRANPLGQDLGSGFSVVISLDEAAPELRWGMTAVVMISVGS